MTPPTHTPTPTTTPFRDRGRSPAKRPRGRAALRPAGTGTQSLSASPAGRRGGMKAGRGARAAPSPADLPGPPSPRLRRPAEGRPCPPPPPPPREGAASRPPAPAGSDNVVPPGRPRGHPRGPGRGARLPSLPCPAARSPCHHRAHFSLQDPAKQTETLAAKNLNSLSAVKCLLRVCRALIEAEG